MLALVAIGLSILSCHGLGNQIRQDLNWWKSSVVYQIYPRSFQDSNGDGVGDLPGIINRLEHVKDLGADALWLSPIYTSPQADFGYDISNFTNIDKLFGSLSDFDHLVAKAKKLGVRVLLDFVPNHSSNKHPWFLKSIDRIKPYDEYYIWRDGKIGPNGERQPPNNWLSVFGNIAWEWNEKRQQYYYHAFAIGQPDLNYRSLKLQQEMKDVLSFWMRRGVDGFRVDAVNQLFEVEDLRDEPLSGMDVPQNAYEYLDHPYTIDQDETYVVVASWRKLLDDFIREHRTDGKPLIIEAHTTLPLTFKYYDAGVVPFNFMFIEKLNRSSSAYDFLKYINDWLEPIKKGNVTNWVIGNHDSSRAATRFGKYGNRADQISMLAMILPGITVVYEGDEIGMVDTPLTYKETLDPQGCIAGPERYVGKSRDPGRTPFQWDNTTSAGFSTNTSTWLPVNSNYKTLNLAAQKHTRISHYKVFQSLSSLKKSSVIREGSVKVAVVKNEVLAVVRKFKQETVTLLINFSDETIKIDAKTPLKIPGTMRVKTASVQSKMSPGSSVNTARLSLRGATSVVLHN
ncbi:hypothetical protein QAD02_023595 [Eretmocerus hayati]|uniref:Uncharacterized protein n=1 Tax=Eretmocerus hayati TaxID=131215 RepID=A0ACC2PW94_9HYME|nr:hypothetical protein QAD02_023595 [Eretmocerus hayati]